MKNLHVAFTSQLRRRGLEGWAMDRDDTARKLQLSVAIDGVSVATVCADRLSPELVEIFKTDGYHGWRLEIPTELCDGEKHEVIITEIVSGKRSNRHFIFPTAAVDYEIQEITARAILGSLYVGPSTVNATVFLENKGRELARSCLKPAGDPGLAATDQTLFHFRLNLPFSVSLNGLDHVTFGYVNSRGQRFRLREIDIPRGNVKGLIVACQTPADDASKYYRAELQRQQLWHSGCEVTLKSHELVTANDVVSVDFIIFQRAPIAPEICAALRYAKELGIGVFYETDDLNFLREMRFDFGAVKSRHTEPDDASLLKWVSVRYDAANFADTVIVSSRFMQRYLEWYGYTTMLSEFRMEPQYILKRRRKKITGRWKLLYMSGSPTHDHDFKEMKDQLLEFMLNHDNVDLTVLGHLSSEHFEGWPRVTMLGRKSYAEMLLCIDEHDLLLAPFAKSAFNFAKSPTKFMEAGSRGVPLIASALPAYIQQISAAGLGYFVPWQSKWYTMLELAYQNRINDHKNSQKLLNYMEKNVSTTAKKENLYWNIADIYGEMIARQQAFPKKMARSSESAGQELIEGTS